MPSFVDVRKKAVNDAPVSPPSPSPKVQRSWPVLTFVFRLLLLSVGVSLAWLVGMAIALFNPGASSEPPLVVQGLRRSQQWLGLRDPASSSAPQPAAPSANLSTSEQQALQQELEQLQAEAQSLASRAAQIEAQIGVQQSNEPLESRIQRLSQQIEGTSDFAQTPGSSSTTPVFRVTLPSDVLFANNQSTLKPEAEPILDSLVGDLQAYPSSTIRVAAHTDDVGSPEMNRALSLQRAAAVESYLSGVLGDGYHWVSVGFGEDLPLATGQAEGDRLRNRRLEITVEPK
ncbi:OmpA/MotB domain protein [Geitlerinema sp. PCC 7407]|nr:OmpA/MotB domain protein [Geitlerinema sp. PCC 7407]